MKGVPRSAENIMTRYQVPLKQAQSIASGARHRFSTRSTLAGSGLKHPFPAHANPTSHEILNLPLDASATDIKKRYLELTKVYHPDTLTAQGMPEDVAYTRFRAVTAAYTALQKENSPLRDSSQTPDDSEAEEIRKRLATWGVASSRLSPLERARRERALDAERNAGKWWKTDMTLYYLIGGVAIAVAFMQFQGRSTSNQKERVKKYIEMRQAPLNSAPRPKDT